MSSERTEAATPRRREEARRKGRVAHSRELVSVAGLVAMLLAVWVYGPRLSSALTLGMTQALSAGPVAAGDGWLPQAALLLRPWPLLLVPLLLAPLVGGLIASVAQTGLLFTLWPLKPDLGRVNPTAGLRRLWSVRSMIELVKGLAKLAIVGFLGYRILSHGLAPLWAAALTDSRLGIAELVRLARELTLQIALTLLVLALLDYLWQRRDHERSLRMTRTEVLEELHSIEGNPLLRARRSERQRTLARGRMMAAVKTADVVLLNPTHLAVALRYDPASMASPTVVAKGRNRLAEWIVEEARRHRVALIRRPPLARALYQAVEVGQQIPPALFQAVAEVLAFVYRLKAMRRSQPPGGPGGDA